MSHRLITIGSADLKHVAMPSGRALCEDRAGGPYLRQDGMGGFSDKANYSPVYSAGTGEPTCTDCIGYLKGDSTPNRMAVPLSQRTPRPNKSLLGDL